MKKYLLNVNVLIILLYIIHIFIYIYTTLFYIDYIVTKILLFNIYFWNKLRENITSTIYVLVDEKFKNIFCNGLQFI